MGLTHSQQALAMTLFDAGAYLDRSRSPGGLGFRLKLHEKNPEKPLSPFYLELRTSDNLKKAGPLTPEIVRQCAQEMFNLAQTRMLDFDAVVGLPYAGDPFAEVFAKIAAESGCPVKLFKMKKEGNTDKRQITDLISDNHKQGDRVLIIDDLCTRADTKFEGIKVIEQNGMTVVDVLVLVDREGGGAAELECRGYRLQAVYLLTTLLKLYRNYARIDDEEYQACVAYLKNA